jgi:type I restriction enzyme S subunit
MSNRKLNPYPKYEPSGINWIGEIPDHWKTQRRRFIGKFSASGIDKKIIEGEPLIKIINYTDIYGNENRILDSKRNYMEVSCPEEKRIEHQVIKGNLIF